MDEVIFKNIPLIDLEELNGKTLKITVATDVLDGIKTTVIAGYDEQSDVTYILKQKQEKYEYRISG